MSLEADASAPRPSRRSASVNSLPLPHPAASSSTTLAESPSNVFQTTNEVDYDIDDETDYFSRRDSVAANERAVSPPHGVPQFPFNSQLVRPLSAAPELLPATPPRDRQELEDGMPSIMLDFSVLPERDRFLGLIDHFGSHTNAAFPILHMPTIRRVVVRAIGGETVKIVQACTVYRESFQAYSCLVMG